MTNLRGKTIFITGGSRGIGRAIALKAAADGANVAIAAKTNEPHPKLPGTIQTVAREIEAIGGKALPLQLDVRRDDDIRVAVAKALSRQLERGASCGSNICGYAAAVACRH